MGELVCAVLATPIPLLPGQHKIITRDQECKIAIHGAQGLVNDREAFIFVARRKKCLESEAGGGGRHREFAVLATTPIPTPCLRASTRSLPGIKNAR
jgi:hypothetical protein